MSGEENQNKNHSQPKQESVQEAGSYSAKRKDNGFGSLKEAGSAFKRDKDHNGEGHRENPSSMGDAKKKNSLAGGGANNKGLKDQALNRAKNMVNHPLAKNLMNNLSNHSGGDDSNPLRRNTNPIPPNPFQANERREEQAEEEATEETSQALQNRRSRPDFLGLRNRNRGKTEGARQQVVSAGIRAFLKKSLPFLLPIFAIFIIGFLFLAFLTTTINNFGPLMGINAKLGKDIEEGYEANDKEEDEFYERVKEVSDEYSEKGVEIEAELVGGVYFILQSYNPNLSMADFDTGMIRKIVKAMFDKEAEEEEDLIYDKDTFITNLIDDIFPSLIPDVDASLYESIADEIFEYVSDYKDLMGENEDESQNNDICIEGNLQAVTLATMSPKEYVETLGPIAQRDYSRTGVFASVTLAQSIEESGWARSGLSLRYNNMFGIKCSKKWKGKCVNMGTKEEYTAGSITNITAAFRVYNSVDESLYDHSLFLKENSRYTKAGVFNAKNGRDQIKAIKRAGYATSSSYVANITNLINTYHLDDWDVTVNTNTSGVNCLGASTGEWDIRTTKPTSSDSAFKLKDTNRGQCVWYAQARAIEVAQNLKKKGKLTEAEAMKIRYTLMGIFGDAGQWYNRAVLSGKFYGSTKIKDIKPGSIIVWSKKGAAGHVAFVENVDTANNTVTITEGWATNGSSCPRSWGCVNFKSNVMSLDAYYKKFGPRYTGAYKFVGYVYALQPKG